VLPIALKMNRRVRVLKQLVRESLYVVDERAAAEAILSRANARLIVADLAFRSDATAPRVRSFRRDPSARSFRLSHTRRLRHVHD
jgi:hypothetical protein